MKFNQQLLQLKQSPIRAFNDQISAIDGIIRVTIGEPDFDTPEFIKQAAINAIKGTNNGYTHSKGMIEVREAIARYVKRKYNLTYLPEDEIIVTAGPTQALFTCLLSLLNPGEKVITPSPNYVIYSTQTQLSQGEFVTVDVSQTDFILTPQQLEAALIEHPETTVLLLNFPSNPTGVTYTKAQLEALVPVIEKYDLWVVSDEIYSELTYDVPHFSMASLLPGRTLLINGLSKSHAMTGWRSGFIAGPQEIINQLFKVHQAMVNTPSTQVQFAAIAAYDQGDEVVKEMRDIYQSRRDYLIDEFDSLGIKTLNPQGAFYLFVKVPDWFKGDDVAFCLALAQQAKVGTIPGSGFGEAGMGYFRISYAASIEELTEVMQRIRRFVENHR